MQTRWRQLSRGKTPTIPAIAAIGALTALYCATGQASAAMLSVPTDCIVACQYYTGPPSEPPVAGAAGSGAAQLTFHNPFSGTLYPFSTDPPSLYIYARVKGSSFIDSEQTLTLTRDTWTIPAVQQYTYGGLTDAVTYTFSIKACLSSCGPPSVESNPWKPPYGCPPPLPLLPPECV